MRQFPPTRPWNPEAPTFSRSMPPIDLAAFAAEVLEQLTVDQANANVLIVYIDSRPTQALGPFFDHVLPLSYTFEQYPSQDGINEGADGGDDWATVCLQVPEDTASPLSLCPPEWRQVLIAELL